MSRVRLSLSHRDSEGSPSCVLGLLLALSSNLVTLFIRWVVFFFHSLERFCFGLWAFPLLQNRSFCQAAIGFLVAASALTPMAQMKPSSSRPTAVTIFLCSLPAAASLE